MCSLVPAMPERMITGKSWISYEPVPAMQRSWGAEGLESCVNDVKPQWQAASGTMLGIGVRVYYRQNARTPRCSQAVARSMDVITRSGLLGSYGQIPMCPCDGDRWI